MEAPKKKSGREEGKKNVCQGCLQGTAECNWPATLPAPLSKHGRIDDFGCPANPVSPVYRVEWARAAAVRCGYGGHEASLHNNNWRQAVALK